MYERSEPRLLYTNRTHRGKPHGIGRRCSTYTPERRVEGLRVHYATLSGIKHFARKILNVIIRFTRSDLDMVSSDDQRTTVVIAVSDY